MVAALNACEIATCEYELGGNCVSLSCADALAENWEFGKLTVSLLTISVTIGALSSVMDDTVVSTKLIVWTTADSKHLLRTPNLHVCIQGYEMGFAI
jgi:hypothetical protein